MTDAPDAELLAQFARNDSEAAFAVLVDRHLALVHSVALRHTNSPLQAQDITQAVFIILARKAGTLGRKTVVAGWLYHTARLTAANFQRAEARRFRREQEAFMQSTLEATEPDTVWRELAPQLDEAMARLGAADRDALVLRFFQNKTLSEIGAELGVEERAAQKRVNRAVEKLRKIFSKRGVTLSALAIAGAVSANSVSAAPVGLAKTISVIAFTKGAAAGGSTLTLVKGVLKIMAWTKAKIAIVAGLGVLLAAGTATVVVVSKQAPLLPIKSLPNPNGYDDLMKAGKMTTLNNLDYSKATLEQLRPVTVANAEALVLARTALSNECRVPLQYSEAYSSNHISDLVNIKKLAQAFLAEGKVAEKENRPNDAAKSYLDAVHLGNESALGGNLMDQLVGTACESIGAGALQNLAGQLDAKSARETAATLETLDTQRQTWNEVRQQEHDWSVRAYPGMGFKIARVMSASSLEKIFALAKQKFQKRQIETRELMVELAVQAYTSDKGQAPASLSELVPDYLKAIPQNPITGKDMMYFPK